ncbi:FG-GAP-like repeat-containing protein [Candidatus Eisenbacteria bacterium]|uniref:FG-GAP-like repeat-containing protein n=1 Tax=Eiseniibacteriota bacterium TaxID=2212470 RepID=A0ABV6YL61_UNCEI
MRPHLIAVAICVGMVMPTVAVLANLQSPSAQPTPDSWADAGWWATASRQIAVSEYEASVTEGGLQAPNRAQNLRTYFRPGVIEIVRRTEMNPSWVWTWQTTAWGRGSRLTAVGVVEPLHEGSRVEYVRPGLTEWYENRKEGLEQGFTVRAKPAGEGALCIEGTLENNGAPPSRLSAVLSPDGEAIRFLDHSGGTVLCYGGLSVRDARGSELTARIALEDGRIRILVDDQGATYPIVIDPILTSPSWSYEGEHGLSQYGWSVSTAGDVNADGYSDLVIGSPDYDSGITDQGKVYVYFGSPSGPGVTADWTAQALLTSVRLGSSVACAGDVNGDGYDDVIVGGEWYSNGQSSEGGAWVWYGGSSGLGAAGTLENADWSAESNQAIGNLGTSVASAGDINNDGYDDIIVGAYWYDNGQSDEGMAFVWLGGASGLGADGNPTNADWRAESDEEDATLGISVATAGDVNGDGYDDVIVGAPRYDQPGVDSGTAFIWFGGSAGLGPDGTPENADWASNVNIPGSWGANAVSTAGDFNGDGYADVLMASKHYSFPESDEGAVFLYMGSATGPGAIPTRTWQSDLPDALMGTSVSTAGDLDGDGFADVVIGATGYETGAGVVGAALVYLGDDEILPTEPDFVIEGDQPLSAFGASVGAGGDVDGDGFGEIIVGAAFYVDGGGEPSGKAFVFRGQPGGLATNPFFDFGVIQVGSTFGFSVASAGDVNGDGYGDIIVGAPLYDLGATDDGVALVYFGSAEGLSTSESWSARGNQDGAELGVSVASAGDVNGDGYGDIIVGASGYEDGEIDEGACFIWFGGSSGLGSTGTPTNADWIGQFDEDATELGTSVASAGDVNGDGFGDVIVGGPAFDSDRGIVLVYLGSPSGPSMMLDWSAECELMNARFGRSVGSAGDINADGYSDIVIGVPEYSDDPVNEESEGWVFVWLGAPGGLGLPGTPSNADWNAQSNQEQARLGFSVATAGDVNGDGYSDLIAGAVKYSNPEDREGAAFVWYGGPAGLGLPGIPANADWSAEGNRDITFFGYSVASAGDVNGDGFSDVIIGETSYTNGEAYEGRASVFHGGSTGLAADAAWAIESNNANAQLGASVGSAGDVNADGFGDVIVSAPAFNDGGMIQGGKILVYHGNEGDGLDRHIRQWRWNSSAPIHPLGISDNESTFRLFVLTRTPAGRGKARLEWEVKPLGTPFNGSGLGLSPAFLDTGTPSDPGGSAQVLGGIVSGLQEGTPYHWRVRILTDSPFFPRSPWFSLAHNGPEEADLRMGGVPVNVDDSDDHDRPSLMRIVRATPNPFQNRIGIALEMPTSGDVRLIVCDVEGRRVATLLEGSLAAGSRTVLWNGQSDRGTDVAPGIYFIQLLAGGELTSRKIVVAR